MNKASRKPTVFRLEIISYLAILLVGLWFAYFIHQKTQFSQENSAEILIEKQAQLSKVTSAVERVYQTLLIEQNYNSASSQQRIQSVVEAARE